jgi:23S rRNA (guanosine2251-2'-O)-methyltransferase
MLTLYGIHPVLEALKKRPRAFHRLFLSRESGREDFAQIVSHARAAKVNTALIPVKELAQMCRSEQHQGVVAEVEPLSLLALEDVISLWKDSSGRALFLILDSIQDPQNFGSLIRSACCCGATAVIFPRDRSATITGAVAKASAGAVEHLPLCCTVNIAAALETLKKEGVWIVGTTPRAEKSVYGFDFNLDMALVIGSEGKGMRQLIGKKCDFLLSIPMQGGLDSLNASVAGAVVLFEIMRQRTRQQADLNT